MTHLSQLFHFIKPYLIYSLLFIFIVLLLLYLYLYFINIMMSFLFCCYFFFFIIFSMLLFYWYDILVFRINIFFLLHQTPLMLSNTP